MAFGPLIELGYRSPGFLPRIGQHQSAEVCVNPVVL